MKKLQLAALFAVMCAAGCSDSDHEGGIRGFAIDAATLTLYDGYGSRISVTEGNRDYTLKVTSGGEFVKAELYNEMGTYGSFIVTGLKPGTGTVEITDNIADITRKVEVTVNKAGLYMIPQRHAFAIEISEGSDPDEQTISGIENELEDRVSLHSDLNYVLTRDGVAVIVAPNGDSIEFGLTEQRSEGGNVTSFTIDDGIPREYTLEMESRYSAGINAYLYFFGYRPDYDTRDSGSPGVSEPNIVVTEDFTGEFGDWATYIESVKIAYLLKVYVGDYPKKN